MFLTSGVVSFNAAVWQIVRRQKKKEHMESQKNLEKPPLEQALPPDDAPTSQVEFVPVRLEGTFDNEGSVLVGPRPIPSYKGAANSDESKGGFTVMTPFEIAGTGQFVMVNRGWVPIEAAKHRTLLAQYIGEGFKPMSLRGVIRKEEFVSTWLGGESPDNFGPLAQDLSWMALRPWNMALAYYKKRWGTDRAEESVKAHGLHRYFVEMVEDYSGDDQRMVRGRAWPRRRDMDELTYVHLTPLVHSMYTVFWLSVSFGSLYGLRKCFLRQKEMFAQRKKMVNQAEALDKKRKKEAQAFYQATLDVQKLQQKK